MEAFLIFSTIAVVLVSFLFANIYDKYNDIDSSEGFTQARVNFYDNTQNDNDDSMLGLSLKDFYAIMRFYGFENTFLKRYTEGEMETVDMIYQSYNSKLLELHFSAYHEHGRTQVFCHKMVFRGRVFETVERDANFFINMDALLIATGFVDIEQSHFLARK
jgi:hypothetical protein